ncbi:unnamed protein product [Cuscuta epithymum]|uniref:Uncharacterized protein n=1 Tax=Cuscuta epithymum TaxID=186058 RepID=A0AAV0DQA5_9ASTE|nr:unnamed protein product [Cuscuta epithymum]
MTWVTKTGGVPLTTATDEAAAAADDGAAVTAVAAQKEERRNTSLARGLDRRRCSGGAARLRQAARRREGAMAVRREDAPRPCAEMKQDHAIACAVRRDLSQLRDASCGSRRETCGEA